MHRQTVMLLKLFAGIEFRLRYTKNFENMSNQTSKICRGLEVMFKRNHISNPMRRELLYTMIRLHILFEGIEIRYSAENRNMS